MRNYLEPEVNPYAPDAERAVGREHNPWVADTPGLCSRLRGGEACGLELTKKATEAGESWCPSCIEQWARENRR